MMRNFLFAALAALAVACAPTPDAPPVPVNICPTPSECPYAIIGICDPDWDSTMLVWLDYEPAPWGPETIECCPIFPDKCPAQAAPICAKLDTTLQPWQLRIWSDSVTLKNGAMGFPIFFCMDEYWGSRYAYFVGDTLKVDLRDYEQVRHYLDTQEQIQFVLEIHCKD